MPFDFDGRALMTGVTSPAAVWTAGFPTAHKATEAGIISGIATSA